MTLAQSLTALEKGNKVRLRRAALKKELFDLPLGESRWRAAELLLERPGWLDTMQLMALLSATKGCGRQRARRLFFQPAGIAEHRRIGQLTQREVDALVPRLRMTQHERRAESSRKWSKAA